MTYEDAVLVCRQALVREAAAARRFYVLSQRGELTAQGERNLQVHSEREVALKKAIDLLEGAQ
jgi:hypothetical protein